MYQQVYCLPGPIENYLCRYLLHKLAKRPFLLSKSVPSSFFKFIFRFRDESLRQQSVYATCAIQELDDKVAAVAGRSGSN